MVDKNADGSLDISEAGDMWSEIFTYIHEMPDDSLYYDEDGEVALAQVEPVTLCVLATIALFAVICGVAWGIGALINAARGVW